MIRLLSGNEGVARGAYEAGVRVVSSYPGTPSTEVVEEVARLPGVYAEWATNEKVALDVAIGAAYTGCRAMTVMKHVGLNVAADALMYASMTGVNAGLVIVVGDDPGMHSSQNEQDSRTLARFAGIPCLEPTDSQEAKDLAITAFDLSERYDTPVLLRLTTRICHSSSAVTLGERTRLPTSPPHFPRDIAKYVMIPAHARRHRAAIPLRTRAIEEFAESFPQNRVESGDRSLGIVTAGIAYQHAREVFQDASILRLAMTWPLPHGRIRDFAASVDRLIVLEELDPFIEQQVRAMGIHAVGKDIFPETGELNPGIVRDCAIDAGLLPESVRIPRVDVDVGPLPPRPPVLCAGCPHRATFYVLAKHKVPVNGDIGCYSLGVAPPLQAMHSLGCMGAGIAVAHGAAKAGSPERHVAVIGDSTFFHTGIAALINAVYNRAPIMTVILDNRSTAMTGHQDNPGTGRTLQGLPAPVIALEPLVRALGVQHVRTVNAHDVDAIEATFRDYAQLDEPAVLIAEAPCALLPDARRRWTPLSVLSERCNGCTLCFRLGCPAILRSEELDEKHHRPKALIDATLCTGCDVCSMLCPRDAIPARSPS